MKYQAWKGLETGNNVHEQVTQTFSHIPAAESSFSGGASMKQSCVLLRDFNMMLKYGA